MSESVGGDRQPLDVASPDCGPAAVTACNARRHGAAAQSLGAQHETATPITVPPKQRGEHDLHLFAGPRLRSSA